MSPPVVMAATFPSACQLRSAECGDLLVAEWRPRTLACDDAIVRAPRAADVTRDGHGLCCGRRGRRRRPAGCRQRICPPHALRAGTLAGRRDRSDLAQGLAGLFVAPRDHNQRGLPLTHLCQKARVIDPVQTCRRAAADQRYAYASPQGARMSRPHRGRLDRRRGSDRVFAAVTVLRAQRRRTALIQIYLRIRIAARRICGCRALDIGRARRAGIRAAFGRLRINRIRPPDGDHSRHSRNRDHGYSFFVTHDLLPPLET